ncbi:unnamed protein product [Prorocentrum cordatum]|uniref:Uncharacterized protein n=1 Tax=Prorocentrum cordatum TaxID=2364126 RepID=A0ABN9WBG9_9DINO|nr:unnamed protein product [Polarella glacialis]
MAHAAARTQTSDVVLRGFHLDERMSEKGRAMADPHRGELGSAPLAARAPLRVRSSASSAPPAVAPTAAFGAARFSVRRGARARSAEAPVDVSAAVAAAVSAATAAAWPQPGAAGRRVEEPQQPGRCPSAAAAPSQQLQQPSRGCGGPAPALRLLEPPSTPSPRARTAGAAQRLDGSTAARPALPGAGEPASGLVALSLRLRSVQLRGRLNAAAGDRSIEVASRHGFRAPTQEREEKEKRQELASRERCGLLGEALRKPGRFKSLLNFTRPPPPSCPIIL